MYRTYSDVFRPQTRSNVLAYELLLLVGATLVIALSAQVSIRLWFTPVPITGQTFAVLLVGTLLGSKRGAVALLTYLAEGLAGMPVFANGTSGWAILSGPTGGYLVGFVAAAFVTGWLAERGWDRRVWTTALAMLIGNLVIYACGLTWLAKFVGTAHVLEAGLTPFLTGDALKIALAAGLLPGGWKLLALLRGEELKS
ncbi:MAG: biotin transporter BioY [Chloroflexota bacterium]|nr:MAG: biotin transporter BioY [Chloroflexota bacterium]